MEPLSETNRINTLIHQKQKQMFPQKSTHLINIQWFAVGFVNASIAAVIVQFHRIVYAISVGRWFCSYIWYLCSIIRLIEAVCVSNKKKRRRTKQQLKTQFPM